MRRTLRLLTLFTVLAPSAALAETPRPSVKVEAPEPSATPHAHPEDVAVMSLVAESVAVQLELSKAALSRATRREVRTFATQAVKHQNAIAAELAELAALSDTALPVSLPQQRRFEIERMTKGTTVDFDASYMTAMVEEHTATLATLEQAAAESKDAELRAWADRVLPRLRASLRQGREIKARMEAMSSL